MKTVKRTILLLLAAFAVVFCLTACGEKELPVDSTVAVTFYGFTGNGTARIEGQYGWIRDFDFKNSKVKSFVEFCSMAENAVTYSLSSDEGLSNGDVITLDIAADNETLNKYGFTAKDSSIEITVSGLDELQEYDVFSPDDIEMSYTDSAPYAQARIGYKDYKLTPFPYEYVLDKSTNLSNGDVITVTVKYDADAAAKKGYYVPYDTKEYVVSGLNTRIVDWSQIPDEVIQKMVEESSTSIEAKLAVSKTYHWLPDDTWTQWGYYADYGKHNMYNRTDSVHEHWDGYYNKFTVNSSKIAVKTAYIFNDKKGYQEWVTKNLLEIVYEVSIDYSYVDYPDSHDYRPFNNISGETYEDSETRTFYVPVFYDLEKIYINPDNEIVIDYVRNYNLHGDYAKSDWDAFYTARVTAFKDQYNILEKP